MTPYTRTRWPGWDGWLVSVLCLSVLGLAAVRQIEGFTGPLLLSVGAAGAYLLLTATLRRVTRSVPEPGELRILTVVPTKDNAGSIKEVIRGCLAHTEHVLVVDDGCTDATATLARETSATVISHASNRGKGAALETALDWAVEHGFSHIVAIDADGQHRPDDLPSFYEAVRARPDAVISGVRDMSDAPKGAGYARANSNFWVWVETGQPMGDTQCGYRAYPVGAIRTLHLVPSRYQWEVEVLVRSVWAGIPVIDHACQVFYPPAEERVSSYRKGVDTARITWLNAHLIAERVLWPPRWFPGRRSWQGGHRGFTAGWRLYLWALKTGGPRPVKAALVPLVAFYWVFLGAQRKGLRKYLKRRLPELGRIARGWALFRLLLNFAWSLVDRFHLLIAGPEGLEIDRSAVPALREQLYGEHAGKGLLVVSGHLGNADLGGSIIRGRDRAVNILLYKAPDDPYFRMMKEVLGDRAPKIIAVNDGAQLASIAVLNALRAGEVVAVKADRTVDGRTATVDFLGGAIRVPTGPFLLAALSGAPVVFIGCFKTPSGGYRIEAEGPRVLSFTSRETRQQDLERWAGEWANLLEGWTERYPLQWYNFFDPWE